MLYTELSLSIVLNTWKQECRLEPFSWTWKCYHGEETKPRNYRQDHANVAFMSWPQKSKDFFFIKSNSSFQIKSFQILVLKNYSKIVGVRWSRRVDHDHCLFLPNQVEHQQLTSSCASCTTRPSHNHALNPGCLNILLILITPRAPSSVYNIQYYIILQY